MHIYRVAANERLTSSTVLLTLEPHGANKQKFDFSPGQYAAISFVKKGRPSVARCFSIVSSPMQDNLLQFSMRTRGRFTSALAKIQVGDEVRVRGPYGGFVFDPKRGSDSIFIAGGIGITPFMSMLRYATDIRSLRRISLVYGVQSQDDIPFHAELDSLLRENANIDVTYVVGDGPTDTITSGHVVTGRISPVLLKEKLAGTSKTIFICGPPPLMNAMVTALSDEGVPHDRIITEAFNQGSHRQSGRVASWPQNMYTLGAVGVGLGAFAILVSEIVASLPNTPLTDEEAMAVPVGTSGQRDADLDALVNTLKTDLSRPDSPSTKAAIKAATASNTPPATVSQPQTSNTPTQTPSVVQPKCTTSQSGVTTCL